MKKECITYLLVAFMLLAESLSAQQLAFPGAEGHGRHTKGGRGGKVVKVTTLDDNASGDPVINGSLRWALQQSSPKTIVFDVSGTINLKQQLKTGKDYITIAGQTAPGDGICIAENDFVINSNNVIIRFLRFRPGDGSQKELDGLGGMDKKDIMIDHCSVSWSVDECLSVYGMENLTVQWCIASEALRVSAHGKGTHCYGGNWGGSKASYHHNLIAHCESRAPRLGPRPSTQTKEHVDIRNNVFYNWAGEGCYGGEGMQVNMINNYYKPGPATAKASSNVKFRIAKIGVRTTKYVTDNASFKPMEHIWGKFYIDGNKVEDNAEVTKDNWTKGVYAQQTNDANVDNLWTQTTRDTIRLTMPLDAGEVTTHSADLAYDKVLGYAGCSLFRDEVDERIVSDTRQKKATYTASGNKAGYINSPSDTKPAGAAADWSPWPVLNQAATPVDTDNDGIPDYWEDENGLDKRNASDANLVNADGYTNLEVYLNSLVEHIISAQNEGGVTDIPSFSSRQKVTTFVNGQTVFLQNLLEQTRISVYTINGLLISVCNVNTSEYSFDLTRGIYILRVVSGDTVDALKVMIK